MARFTHERYGNKQPVELNPALLNTWTNYRAIPVILPSLDKTQMEETSGSFYCLEWTGSLAKTADDFRGNVPFGGHVKSERTGHPLSEVQ
jgi:hypothetical protein